MEETNINAIGNCFCTEMNKNSNEILERALSHSLLGEFDESEALLLSISNQNDVRVTYNLGWHHLRHGEFRKGFEGLDTGRWIEAFGSPRLTGRMWKDENLNGKTLLFRGEGGIGDQIINARFIRSFQQRGANVIFSCDSGLWGLFAKNGIQCCSTEAAEAAHVYYDYWVPAMSSAYMLGHTYDTLPSDPYLTAPEDILVNGKFRIGLRWGGNVENKIESYRAIDPAYMKGLCRFPGVEYFSFQRDAGIADGPWMDLHTELIDWGETAKWLKSMDLLITSCTSVAHMAAAIGVETWVIVPLLSYYTWALPGDKSPWHDKIKIFRQVEPDNWSAPIAQVDRELSLRLTAAA